MKRGKMRRNWKLRWLELDHAKLSYFKCTTQTQAERRGAIPRSDIVDVKSFIEVGDAISWPPYYPPKQQTHARFAIVTNSRTFYFVAASAEECRKWKQQLLEPVSVFQTNAIAYNRRETMNSCHDQFEVLQRLLQVGCHVIYQASILLHLLGIRRRRFTRQLDASLGARPPFYR